MTQPAVRSVETKPGQPVCLSVVVLSWNALELLRHCLVSIAESDIPFGYEVIVVDNASDDGSPEMVAREFPWVRLIQLHANLGYARGNNAGIRPAKGTYVLLLNSDTEISGPNLRRLVEEMDGDPNLGAAGPLLTSPDGSRQRSWYRFPSLRLVVEACAANRPGLRWLHRWVRSRNRGEEEIDAPMGACLMLRKEALKEVGLLDPGYYLYGEELDLCFRLKQANWKRTLVSDTQVVHWGGGSSSLPGLWQHWRNSHRRFFRKFRSPLASFLLEVIFLFPPMPEKKPIG